MLCTTNATAADELARSVYNVAQTPQNQQVTGRVLDAAGEPLIGVSIVEKATRATERLPTLTVTSHSVFLNHKQ